ncbi:MAG: type 2 lanthipeptide synthetase LanM family protein [bacterium]
MPVKPGLSYYLQLAGKAAPFRQKFEERVRFNTEAAAGRRFTDRLEAWKKSVGPGDDEMFKRRLENDGIAGTDLPALLGTFTVSSEDRLPGWVDPFREMLGFLIDYPPEGVNAEMTTIFGAGTEKKIPFLHILTPVVLFATRRVTAKAGGASDRLFTPESRHLMNLQLASLLSMYMSQVLFLEFQAFRAIRQTTLERILNSLAETVEPESGLYLEFVNKILNGGWPDLFAEYSVLARIITTVKENWENNSLLFISRLDNDYDTIKSHFAGAIPPGKLIGFKGGISDVHNHGKSVISLAFESGLKLIYKPKNLELELAWSELLSWYNEKGLTPQLKPIDVINRGNYGWVGFIEPAPCTSEQEVTGYYKRIGALVGLIYLLNGNDCHKENLIAAGACPVIIDLESVMHHDGKTFMEEFTDTASYLANMQFGTSVFRTGLLPAWVTGKEGFIFDVSGIGSYDRSESPYRQLRWDAVNTDIMDLSYVPYPIQELPNIPLLNGKKQPPAPFTDEIISGFSDFYRLTLLHRSGIPLHLFAGKELRFIFRSTRIYGIIQKNLLKPEFMRDGSDRGIRLELLARAFLHSDAPNPYWVVFKSEYRQMEEMDFPIFWANSDSSDLKDNTGIISQEFMTIPVYRKVLERLPELDEKELAKQIRFIRASLFFREIRHNVSANPLETDTPEEEDLTAPFPDDFLGKSLEITRILQKEAIFSKDGSCSWISVGVVPATERYRMQPMSVFLYDGFAGVALYLSALFSITGDPVAGRLNECTIRSLRQGLEHIEKNRSLFREFNTGIGSGLSSLIYSLVRIAGFLSDPSFVDDAMMVAGIIDRELISRDKIYDIISGSAGCILGMLTLYKETSEREMLEKAVFCGEHLVQNVSFASDGTFGWKTMPGLMPGGFSHGSAGIAYALLKLYEATGEIRYRETAEKAILYENRLFSSIHGNWADIRSFSWSTDEPRFMNSWCHGAPGVGLARLAGSPLLNNETISANILAAKNTTLKAPLRYADHLCCGNFGRIEFLLRCAREGNDLQLRKVVYEMAGRVIRQAEKKGHFYLFSAKDDFFNPGFFQGVSGIGYEMLRLAFPEKTPSVLIFE